MSELNPTWGVENRCVECHTGLHDNEIYGCDGCCRYCGHISRIYVETYKMKYQIVTETKSVFYTPKWWEIWKKEGFIKVDEKVRAYPDVEKENV